MTMEVLRTLLVLLFIIIVLCLNGISDNVVVEAQSQAQNPSSIGAMYQFGDSISDTGNDVLLSPGHGCGLRPYGESFFSQPTGRCSNGLLMVDYFARAFKIPLLSPFLNKSGDFRYGANFAVSGATALNTSQTSLWKQLDWFDSYLPSICANPTEYKQKLGNALFLVGEIGGNDYNSQGFGDGSSPDDLRSLVPIVISAIAGAVKHVIDRGATRVLVPGNFAVGCMTIYLALHKSNDPTMYDELGCLKNWNDLASFHNDQLQGAIKTLQGQYPDVKITCGDYFNGLKTIFQQANALGFDKDGIHKACCGSGDNEYNFGGQGCGTPGAVCPDPNHRVSWDGFNSTGLSSYGGSVDEAICSHS